MTKLILSIAALTLLTVNQATAQQYDDTTLFEHVNALVWQAKQILGSDDARVIVDHTQNLKAKQSLEIAKKNALKIRDYYRSALAYLLIAEGYAIGNPELPRRIGTNPDGSGKLWYPYKGAIRILGRTQGIIVWLSKSNYENKYGFIGDICFFVHLQYDYLRNQLEAIPHDDSDSMHIQEHPSRIAYQRGLQAIDQAINNEAHSAESNRRREAGIQRPTEKVLLYSYAKSLYVKNGVSSSELPLIEKRGNYYGTLNNMAATARKNGQVRFKDTKAFQFFDFLGSIFIPKYGLLKRANELITGN